MLAVEWNTGSERRAIGVSAGVATALAAPGDPVNAALRLTHLQPEVHHVALSQSFQLRPLADFEGHRHRIHVVRNFLMLYDDTVDVRPEFTNDSPCLEGAERGIRAGRP